MDNPGKATDTAYGPQDKRKSTNLLTILMILVVLIVVVFSGLHFFGQRFGVQV